MNLDKGGKQGSVAKTLKELEQIEKLTQLVQNLDVLSDCIYDTTSHIKRTINVLDLPNLKHLKGEYKKKLQTVTNELFTLYENVSSLIVKENANLKIAKQLKHQFEITGRARECTIAK
jgi:hypothetical protein